MISNYWKTAIRNLMRHKFFSLINIFGLALAMCVGMSIIMLVADQMKYDRHNTKRGRIFRVTTIDVNREGEEMEGRENATSAMPLRNELMEKYTGLEMVVRLKRGFGNHWLKFEGQDVNIPLAGFFADPEVLDLFEYKLQYGDPVTALSAPYSVVLTRQAANKLFEEENPLGLTVDMGELGMFTVTGVLAETTQKSHIVFEALASLSTVKNLGNEPAKILDDWTNYWEGWTYVLLEPGTSPTTVKQHLDQVYDEHIGTITSPGVHKMKFRLQALVDITPGPMMNNSIGPVLPWAFVWFLSGLAAVILLTSCFNFTNLSIARSLARAREIGVRKVTGAARWQIFVQFLSESVIVACLALTLAGALLFILEPLILRLNFARIFMWDLERNFYVYAMFVGFAVTVGAMAGFFPALVLSAFQPVKVLKGLSNMKVFSRTTLRKVLLVAQFSVSLFFILTVIVVQNQLTLFLTKDHGFATRKNFLIRLNGTDPNTLKTELLKYSDIESAAAASHIPAAGESHGSSFKRTLDDPEWISLGRFSVDEDYVRNMGVSLVAGNFFNPEQQASNINYIVINEEAVAPLGFESAWDAIGEEIVQEYDSSRRTIIGVVANYNHRDLTQSITPMALVYNPEAFGVLQVRYAGTYDNAVRTIEKAWASVNPGLKIDYTEIESEIHQYYEIVFGDLAKVLSFTAFLAIGISCMGLLGMATYTTETRIREVSIRKVLGSGSVDLVLLLSKGFLLIVTIAIALGVPAAILLNMMWLELIAYHTDITATMVLQGVLFLLLFACIAVGSQTLRAAFVNPVDNLRNE